MPSLSTATPAGAPNAAPLKSLLLLVKSACPYTLIAAQPVLPQVLGYITTRLLFLSET